MTAEEINALLAIAQHGNMTTAAEKTYTSQSTLSRRIQALEDELGYQIIVRGKGMRNVVFTPQGENLLLIAEQWRRLWNEMKMLGNSGSQERLRLAAVNSLMSYVIYPAANLFLSRHPELRLRLESQHSYTAIERVSAGLIDGAFVCNAPSTTQLEVIPLWSEPMLLVAGQDVEAYPRMPPDALDVSREIRVPWNSEFEEWHDYWYDPKKLAYMNIDQMGAVEHLMSNQSLWMVAPVTAAVHIADSTHARTIPLSSSPERNILYIAKKGNLQPIVRQLLDHLLDFVSRFDGVVILDGRV